MTFKEVFLMLVISVLQKGEPSAGVYPNVELWAKWTTCMDFFLITSFCLAIPFRFYIFCIKKYLFSCCNILLKTIRTISYTSEKSD